MKTPTRLLAPTCLVARACFVVSAALVSTAAVAQAADVASATGDQDEQMRFFENRIRPLLVSRCFECHAEDNVEGGLRFDRGDMVTKGSDSGLVVVPGNPEESLLVSAIQYDDLEMPPDEPLSAQEKADLVQWIKLGAYWPIDDHAEDVAEDSGPWWAAQPLDPGEIPSVSPNSGSRHVVDRYIDRRLDESGLRRAPRADRVRLIRRLTYDLTGLPPTPEAIEQFVSDARPNAYERLVDRLLADPAYGERMARLWLDLVRYAESDGWRADAFRPQAWRYRQFVVDAFNQGMPYDRFVALQLAGDEIAPGDPEALAAAGFLRLGIYEYNQRDAEGQWQNIIDEITDVTADVFLATGMACAKCHDHKFDPIPRADYFRLRSVFEPVSFVNWDPPKATPDASTQTEIKRLLDELEAIEGEAVRELGEAVVDKFPLDLQAMYRKPYSERNSYEHQIAYLIERQYTEEGQAGDRLQKKLGKDATAQREKILKALDALDANPKKPAAIMTITDARGTIRPTRLPGRSKGRAFDPGSPTILGGDDLTSIASADSSGRRSSLASWITSQTNPITARVMVNRLWQYHFGTGLVSSPNDFGRLGTTPSHPQLLDYLSDEFVRSDWSIQSIQRLIVSSETYKQSAVNPDEATALQIDAANRLHWHRSVRRLDAEQYRDSLLVAMNSLIDQIGGPSITGTAGRRSLYLRRMRNSADEILATLDAPPGIVGTAKRDVTITAPQTLMMMNSSRIVNAAKSFASRVRRDVGSIDNEAQAARYVRRAHVVIAGVEADPATVELLAPIAAAGQEGQNDVCHVLLNSNSFLFID